MVFKNVDVNAYLYPTPKRRIEEPKDTYYRQGDLVKVLVGPASGKIGKVVVERNGNYLDYEPYVSEQSIGVAVLKRDNLELKGLDGLIDPESLVITEIRWFDSPDQLEMVRESRKQADSAR